MKMKNKRAVQEDERPRHKELLKFEKRNKRKNSGKLERENESTLEIKPNILIVCEGEVTEPSYFE